MSFSRSRVNVANASSTSINEVPDATDSPQRIYSDNVNQSRASLLSQVSNSSNRSKRATSPSSLERSYAALRSTSFRRFLGRGGQGSTAAPALVQTPTPPSSPPSRRTELAQPRDSMYSPAREGSSAPAQAMTSPPSSWLGLRRSSEATPTRSSGRSERTNSDSRYRDSPAHPSWALPTSPTKHILSAKDADQWSEIRRSFGDDDDQVRNSRTGNRRVSSKDFSSPLKGIRAMHCPPSAGLRRDFSSSNTLRATASPGYEVGSVPVKAPHDSPRANVPQSIARSGTVRSQGQDHSDEAFTGQAISSRYPYMGEKMLRGSDDRGSASRSVSASTAHSHTSNESVYGYRMRKQVSSTSGHEAHDSETSYGTSVSSSPGLSNASTSGWLSSFGKRSGASMIDTGDTPWSASVDLAEGHDPLKTLDDHHNRPTSMPGSRSI